MLGYSHMRLELASLGKLKGFPDIALVHFPSQIGASHPLGPLSPFLAKSLHNLDAEAEAPPGIAWHKGCTSAGRTPQLLNTDK